MVYLHTMVNHHLLITIANRSETDILTIICIVYKIFLIITSYTRAKWKSNTYGLNRSSNITILCILNTPLCTDNGNILYLLTYWLIFAKRNMPSCKSAAFALEYKDNHEEIFSRYYIRSDICNKYISSTTQYCVGRCILHYYVHSNICERVK